MLTRDYFKNELRFVEYPHFTIGNGLYFDLGRDRILSVSDIGTPNEFMHLCEREGQFKITDVICIHNYDYDGYLTEEKMKLIMDYFQFTKTKK